MMGHRPMPLINRFSRGSSFLMEVMLILDILSVKAQGSIDLNVILIYRCIVRNNVGVSCLCRQLP